MSQPRKPCQECGKRRSLNNLREGICRACRNKKSLTTITCTICGKSKSFQRTLVKEADFYYCPGCAFEVDATPTCSERKVDKNATPEFWGLTLRQPKEFGTFMQGGSYELPKFLLKEPGYKPNSLTCLFQALLKQHKDLLVTVTIEDEDYVVFGPENWIHALPWCFSQQFENPGLTFKVIIRRFEPFVFKTVEQNGKKIEIPYKTLFGVICCGAKIFIVMADQLREDYSVDHRTGEPRELEEGVIFGNFEELDFDLACEKSCAQKRITLTNRKRWQKKAFTSFNQDPSSQDCSFEQDPSSAETKWVARPIYTPEEKAMLVKFCEEEGIKLSFVSSDPEERAQKLKALGLPDTPSNRAFVLGGGINQTRSQPYKVTEIEDGDFKFELPTKKPKKKSKNKRNKKPKKKNK